MRFTQGIEKSPREKLRSQKAYLGQCYSENAPKSQAVARKTLAKVMKKVGYLPVKR